MLVLLHCDAAYSACNFIAMQLLLIRRVELNEMITNKNMMIYSVAAARRLFAVAKELKVKVQVWFNVIWLHIEGQRPTFVSKKKFNQHFVDWRKAQARSLTATQWLDRPSRFTVRNEAKQSVYVVDCGSRQLECSCEDFKNQIELIGRGCCKHGYAVLAQLGHDSLSSYVNTIKSLRQRTAAA